MYQASNVPPGPLAASNFVAAGLLTALYDTVVRANTIGLQPVVKISHMSQGGRKRRQGMSCSGRRLENDLPDFCRQRDTWIGLQPI